MKLAVVTLVLGDRFKELAKVTHPSLQSYAGRIGADFVVITDQRISKFPHFEKFRLYDILAEYNRVIFLDTDTIVRHDCPNLFDIVPQDRVGMYGEGFMANEQEQAVHRRVMEQSLHEYYNAPPPAEWNREFYNTGVIVASQCHKDLFIPPPKELPLDYWDQAFMNARLTMEKIKVFDIGYRFNRMYYVDKVVKQHRLYAHVVHYAGVPNCIELAKRDLSLWAVYRSTPEIFWK
jgi:lipopolysaccharide biosynthesis glycosyltransferase